MQLSAVLLTIGLPAIDESLDKLLVAMETFPNVAVLGGKGLESATKAMAQAKNKEVAAFELKVAQKQSEYLDRLRTVQDSIATAQQVAAIGQDAAWWDKLIYNVENLGNTINNYAQRAVVATETKVSEWINDVIRFVGELSSASWAS